MSTLLALRGLLFAGEMLVGSALLMLLAQLIALRSGSAGARHLAWVGAFLASLTLPLFTLAVPAAIRIGLTAPPPPVAVPHLVDVQSVGALVAPVETQGFSFDLPTVVLAIAAIWVAGACLVALRSGLALVCLAVLKHRSRPFALLPENLPRIPATRRECELRLSHSDNGPMTWGLLRPVILLPRNARAWPRDRLQAVLLHELAHIRRRDSLAHALSLAVCALYWPNPFVWLGARALRREAEMAADDCVIAQGFKASDYAGELLGLAAEFRGLRPVFSAISLSMAAPSSLKARIESLLSATHLRTGVSAMDAFRTAGIGVAAATALAFACPSLAQDETPPASPPPAELSAPPSLPEAPNVAPLPPVPPAPAAPATPAIPPTPPAPAVDVHVTVSSDERAHGVHRHARRIIVDGRDWNTLSSADKERIRLSVEKATREAHEAIEKARPEIARAMREARKVSRDASIRAVEESRPQIDAAMAEVARARPQIDAAMEEVRRAQPQIEKALAAAKPQIDAALAKVREELAKEHLDANLQVRVDEALKRAEIRIDAARVHRDGDDAPDAPGNTDNE